MDKKKQKLLVEYMVSSPDTFAMCIPIVKPKYFDSDLQGVVTFIKKYYDEHNVLPAPEIIRAETGKALNLYDISRDKVEYCATEIETFCRDKAIEQALLASVDLYKEGKREEIHSLLKEAVLTSLNRNLGIDFFDEPEKRLRQLLNTEIYQETGWKEFDELLNGGIARKQMLLFSANSGVGKSIVMANLGMNFVEKGMNVLILSLELSEEMIYLRVLSMLTGISTTDWKQNIDKCVNIIESSKGKYGNLFLKRMPQETNSNDIRAYLKEFELKYGVPDMIIVDYIDLMSPTGKVSKDNIFLWDKQTSEELREIGEDYNAFIITASQLNRDAVGASVHNHAHIAGGISKINTTDVWVTIYMSDSMKARGEISFQFGKTRSSDGVGHTITLDYNKHTLRITDPSTIKMNINKENRFEEAEEDNDIDDETIIGLMSSSLP